MARLQLTQNNWGSGSFLADVANVAANNGGNSFLNSDGLNVLRVVNSQANANAIITLTSGGTWTGTTGSFKLYIKDALGVVYTATVTVAQASSHPSNADISAAILAATNSAGVALSTTYPSAGLTMGGGPLYTPTPVTAQFTGTSGLNNGGLASTPMQVSVDPTGIVGGTSPTLTAATTTAGTGTGVVTIEAAAAVGAYSGLAVPNLQYLIPGASAVTWIGPFNPNVYNQTGGLVNVDWDNYANYTVTCFHINSPSYVSLV